MAHELLLGVGLVAIIAGFVGSFNDYGDGTDPHTLRLRRRVYLWRAVLGLGLIGMLAVSRLS